MPATAGNSARAATMSGLTRRRNCGTRRGDGAEESDTQHEAGHAKARLFEEELLSGERNRRKRGMANQRMCSSVGTGAATAKSTRTQGQEGRAEQQRTCHAKPSIFPAWQIKPDEQSQRSGLGEKRPRAGNDPTGAMLAGTQSGTAEEASARRQAWTKNGRMVGEALLCSARWPRGASGEATSTTQTT
ncbi:hypothetical protein ERJ75_000907300 [Trypanosoma vivax]|nr:hypothetical protein ERJ75_000907300 [Trypanosoma vivax]